MCVDSALVFLNDPSTSNKPATHVLIIGVGRYRYGKGQGQSLVAGDLRQLSSPPISARALADWFTERFENPAKPLGSVALLISEDQPTPHTPKLRPDLNNHAPWLHAGGGPFIPPEASLPNARTAAAAWAARLRSHRDNMAVFCFCGHGVLVGQKAALLLDDFGEPGRDYDGAIDVDTLLGTMKNCPAVQQMFLLDCCRTGADEYYKNEDNIGSRLLSLPWAQRGHTTPEQQFVLFPTLDGETAFGIRNDLSVFTRSILDALSYAAADRSTGVWQTNTGNILTAVDKLVRLRVPQDLMNRATPFSPNGVAFDFNQIPSPRRARSFVTLSDLGYWGKAQLACVDIETNTVVEAINTSTQCDQNCWSLDLNEGKWKFTGALPMPPPPHIKEHEQFVSVPVAYVRLEVVP